MYADVVFSVFNTPVKQQTKDFYSCHIVGSQTTYNYDVKKKTFQAICGGNIVSESVGFPLTPESFFKIVAEAYNIFMRMQGRLN